MKKAFFISGLLGLLALVALRSCAQRPSHPDKLDPMLLVELTKSVKANDSTVYPCIIYTKEPDAVRKTGVHLNSVFPTFATAQLTKKQIFRLIKLRQVTYIASPKSDLPQPEGAGMYSL